VWTCYFAPPDTINSLRFNQNWGGVEGGIRTGRTCMLSPLVKRCGAVMTA
jgi:chorismate synthase